MLLWEEPGDAGLIPRSGRSPGGGNGNPLQDSCLGNPMDRGARWAPAHGVTESRARLSSWAWAQCCSWASGRFCQGTHGQEKQEGRADSPFLFALSSFSGRSSISSVNPAPAGHTSLTAASTRKTSAPWLYSHPPPHTPSFSSLPSWASNVLQLLLVSDFLATTCSASSWALSLLLKHSVISVLPRGHWLIQPPILINKTLKIQDL